MGYDEVDSQDGHSALIYAAKKGRADCARLLIDAGANKDATGCVRRQSIKLISFHFSSLIVSLYIHQISPILI